MKIFFLFFGPDTKKVADSWFRTLAIHKINETQYLHIINKLFKRCAGYKIFYI